MLCVRLHRRAKRAGACRPVNTRKGVTTITRDRTCHVNAKLRRKNSVVNRVECEDVMPNEREARCVISGPLTVRVTCKETCSQGVGSYALQL